MPLPGDLSIEALRDALGGCLPLGDVEAVRHDVIFTPSAPERALSDADLSDLFPELTELASPPPRAHECQSCGALIPTDNEHCRHCGAEPVVVDNVTKPDAASARSGQPRARRAWIAVGVLALLVIIGIAGVRYLDRDTAGSGDGELRATGEPWGDFVLEAQHCKASYGSWSAARVWVLPARGTTETGREAWLSSLQIVTTDEGFEVGLKSPHDCTADGGCSYHYFDASACTVFDLDLHEETNLVYGTVYAGHAHFDCTVPEGGTLSGRVEFEECLDTYQARGH